MNKIYRKAEKKYSFLTGSNAVRSKHIYTVRWQIQLLCILIATNSLFT